MSIEIIEVHVECDVCGESGCAEIHPSGDTYTETEFEAALKEIDWTLNRGHHLRHLCEECAERLAREEAGDEGEDADEEEDADA